MDTTPLSARLQGANPGKTYGSESEKEGTLFVGVLFVLAGFDAATESQFAAALEQHGGLNVGRYDASCTHVIVSQLLYDDPVCAAARKDGKALVTDLWVADSLDLGVVLDASSVLYRPLREPGGIPRSKTLVICLTGYQGQARRDVMRMVEMMGARFTKPLIATSVTHLICYKFEGEKYRLANQLGVKLVNHQWLEDCLKQWVLLPEENYSKSGWELELSEVKANDSEDGDQGNKVCTRPGISQNEAPSYGPPQRFGHMVVHASTWVRSKANVAQTEEEKILIEPVKETVINHIFKPDGVAEEEKVKDSVHQSEDVTESTMERSSVYSTKPQVNKICLTSEEKGQLDRHRQETVEKSISGKKELIINCVEMIEGQKKSIIGDCGMDNGAKVASTPVKRKKLVLGKEKGAMEKAHQDAGLSEASVHKMKLDANGEELRYREENKLDIIDDCRMDHSGKAINSSRRKRRVSSKENEVIEPPQQKAAVRSISVSEPAVNESHEIANDADLSLHKRNKLNSCSMDQAGKTGSTSKRKSRVTCSQIHEGESTEKEHSIVTERQESTKLDINNCSMDQGGKPVSTVGNTVAIEWEKGRQLNNIQLETDKSGLLAGVTTVLKETGKIYEINLSVDENTGKVNECPFVGKETESMVLDYQSEKMNDDNLETLRTADVSLEHINEDLLVVKEEGLMEQACESVAEKAQSLSEAAYCHSKLNIENAGMISEGKNKSNSNNYSNTYSQKSVYSFKKGRKQFNSKVSGSDLHDGINSDKENCFSTDGQGALQSRNILPRTSESNLLAEVTKGASDDVLLNNNRFPGNKADEPRLQIETKQMVFALSGHRHERKSAQDIIKKLGGRICKDSHQWCHQTTHLVIPAAIRRTEKFFAAVAAGRWILKFDYLEACSKAGRFLDEKQFEWHGRGMNEDGSICLEAPRKWRQLRESTGCRAFHGLRVLVYGECIIPPLDTLKRAIKAGGGNILATAPPYTRFFSSGSDFAIVSPGTPRDDIWVQEFLKQGVACVTMDYFVDFVCKPSFPRDRHVLFDTNSAVAEALKLLQKNIECAAEENSDVRFDSSKDKKTSGGCPVGTKALNSGDEIACFNCGETDRDEVMLLCGDDVGNGCGVAMHIDCCKPPLKEVPENDWFCENCTKRPAIKKTKRRKK